MQEQELRPLPNLPEYLIGQDGSVWSTKRGAPRQLRTFQRDRSGHYGVNLMRDGQTVMFAVHQLVALVWIGPRPSPGHLVMHKDDDPANNAAGNLEYGLPKQNSEQMVARGRQARGERIGISKLTAACAQEIRNRATRGERKGRIALDFGISATTVCDIVRGRTWRI